MKLKISDLIDVHKNKTAYVVANGPSTKNILNYLKTISKNKDKNVVFVCNEADQIFGNIGINLIEDINPDYWVLSNSHMTIQNYPNLNLLKKNNGKLIYADSVDLTSEPDKYLNIDYLPYDQRHFQQLKCSPEAKCCSNIKERLTIQEELQQYTSSERRYGTGSTVALHMLSFAVLTGCSRIMISGVDLNYSLGYFDSISYNPDSFIPHLQQIVEDFSIINESCKLKNIKLFNLSKESPLSNVIETIK
jgi:hypothetical protein